MGVIYGRPEVRSAAFGPKEGAQDSDLDDIHFSPSESLVVEPEFRGPDANRRIVSGSRTSNMRPTSPPKNESIVL